MIRTTITRKGQKYVLRDKVRTKAMAELAAKQIRKGGARALIVPLPKTSTWYHFGVYVGR